MIYFLYGTDAYRRDEKKRWIIGEYKKKHSSLSISTFDLRDEEGEGWEGVKNFIKNRSLFAVCALAVIAGTEGIPEKKDDLAWLAGIAADKGVVFVISAEKVPRKALSFLVKKPAVWEEFPFLTGAAFREFVASEAARRGAHLSEKELADIGTQYRADMWGLMTELDMRALSGNKSHGAHAAPMDFIMMIKALAYGSQTQKICAAECLLETEDPAKAFNVLTAFVPQGKKSQMADYDVAVKSGKLDYEAALVDFAIR